MVTVTNGVDPGLTAPSLLIGFTLFDTVYLGLLIVTCQVGQRYQIFSFLASSSNFS